MTAPIDYTAVLADLEAKRGQIDAAIAVIRTLVGEGSAAQPQGNGGDEDNLASLASAAFTGTAATPPRTAATVQSDSFFRLSTAAAVKKYLGMVKRPQTPRAIAEALRAGGQVHATDEKTAYINVYTALRRGKGDFAKTRTGEWGLVEWYGNRPKGDGE